MIGFDSGSMTTTMLMVGVDDVVVGNTTSMYRELLFVRVRLCFFLLTMLYQGIKGQLNGNTSIKDDSFAAGSYHREAVVSVQES